MITKELFGKMPCGCEVYAYTMANDSIVSAKIISYGGIITNLWVKDKNGEAADVVSGFDNLEGYLTSGGHQGTLVGRTANRIAGGRFTLDGKEYQLTQNEGENTLHGGNGFHTRIWNVEEADGEEPRLILTLTSPDGDQGYPGTLRVKVTYTLTKDAGLSIHYEAETDQPTIVNLTSHSYFNMAGYASGPIDNLILWLNGTKVNSVDKALIPDGTFIDVAETPFDFTEEKAIGRDLRTDFGGYDINYVFPDWDGTMKLQGSLRDPKSGRGLKMYTNCPCVQIYTADCINPEDPVFKNGVKQSFHCGICLETQAMPDSINHEGFTNTILRPGEKYDTTTVFVFEN